MKLIVGIIFLLGTGYALHPDAGLNIYQLIERYNFTWEEYEVQTEDGYLIDIQRIPNGRNGQTGAGVVLLMHGLSSTAADYVNNAEKSLAFLLADLGFDVWLGNSRGNKHARKHISLDPDADKALFWNFSWEETGIYDLPAIIDKALEISGAETLSYAGHSQGTTVFFVMASMRPEYNKKINVAQALSPIVFMEHMFTPWPRALAQYHLQLEQMARNIGWWEFSSNNENYAACAPGEPLYQFCRDLLFMICGYDEPQLAPDMVSIIISNLPSGASVNNLLHYAQEIVGGHFGRWDYHSAEANLEVYGQETPPNYDLSLVTAPVALHYGQNDWFAAIVDVHRLRDALPNVVEDNMVEYQLFNHADFLWATDVDTLLFHKVIPLFQKYSN